MRISIAVLALLASSALPNPAPAATITFSTAPTGVLTAPVMEAGFTYSTLSGGLVISTVGNPGNDLAGEALVGGGILDLKATNNQTFFFGGLDYAAFGSTGQGSQTLSVTGLQNNAFVGTATYTVNNTATAVPSWTSFGADVLANITLDDLHIQLFGGVLPQITRYQSIDNVILSPTGVAAIPEPTSWALMLAGVALAGSTARKRRSS